LRGILLAAGAELLLEPHERAPAIVHAAVERAGRLVSARERAFLNAVLRRLPAALAAAGQEDGTPPSLARAFSHPAWLVERWTRVWGGNLRPLLAWNQGAPGTFLRHDAGPAPSLPLAEPTPWPGFYLLRPGADWDLVAPRLASGAWTVQNPAQGAAAALLAVCPGETVLDLAAAPGGKSRALAQALGPAGRLAAVDLPGDRLERLRAALAPFPWASVHAADVTDPGALAAAGVPAQADAVLLDVPCSNTGVLQRKPDVKWRLEPGGFARLADLQGRLLRAAADRVRPGGRLVYATCSLEPEENDGVVETFLLAAGRGWSLVRSVRHLPWVDGTDGAAAFLLARAPA
jgi:16S rRNA (cytosine967-C5)-methyltransferase